MATWEENIDPYSKYYILIKDNIGRRYEKKGFIRKMMSTTTEFKEFDALRGTLYEKAPDDKQPNNISMVGLISIEKTDNEIYSLDVQLSDVRELSFTTLQLLLTVTSIERRYEAIIENQTIIAAEHAEIGDVLLVKNEFRGSGQDMKYGTIKAIKEYKGGLYFYVSFQVKYLSF